MMAKKARKLKPGMKEQLIELLESDQYEMCCVLADYFESTNLVPDFEDFVPHLTVVVEKDTSKLNSNCSAVTVRFRFEGDKRMKLPFFSSPKALSHDDVVILVGDHVWYDTEAYLKNQKPEWVKEAYEEFCNWWHEQ